MDPNKWETMMPMPDADKIQNMQNGMQSIELGWNSVVLAHKYAITHVCIFLDNSVSLCRCFVYLQFYVANIFFL